MKLSRLPQIKHPYAEEKDSQIKEDGRFEVQPWENSPEDWKAILRVYKIKEKK